MVEIRLATDDELRRYGGRTAQKAVAMIGYADDGRFIAAGGLDYVEGGEVHAWARTSREAKRHKLALWRTCRQIMDAARAAGHQRILAAASPIIPRAPAFLERLGFREVGMRDHYRLFEWRP